MGEEDDFNHENASSNTSSHLVSSLTTSIARGQYIHVLASAAGTRAIRRFVSSLLNKAIAEKGPINTIEAQNDEIAVGLAALAAFLQLNITGPVLDGLATIQQQFVTVANEIQHQSDERSSSTTLDITSLRKSCLASLEVDGVAPYPYIPSIELFALSRFVLCDSKVLQGQKIIIPSEDDFSAATTITLPWARLRVQAWHYRLLTQPNLGPGSTFTKSSQWSDVPSLVDRIVDAMREPSSQVLDGEVWSQNDAFTTADKVELLLELVNYHVMLGRDDRAKETLARAVAMQNFEYALSGALGKRTKFQDKSTSQLVVLAKSAAGSNPETQGLAKPDTVDLNDDTLLEEVAFSKEANGHHDSDPNNALPPSLANLEPDDQPQLSPLDQMILLAEATLKDSFSPLDTLTSEEILPYAVRVIADKSTNWQIYTQALLVRSRIEVHRSRTVERGIMQMQAVVDQVIVDATAPAEKHSEAPVPPQNSADASSVPIISISGPDTVQPPAMADIATKPTSFFPAPKPSESAPAQVRLRYIHALASPPRWHLESELAYAWTSVGSLISALEIFKRLRLWAEVALCLAASDVDDDNGRGSGGAGKARAIVRWRLFHRKATDTQTDSDPEAELASGEEPTSMAADDWTGPERVPPPPNAPRLFCILGDLEQDPKLYERAWDISRHRYSRAQKSLGEHWLQQKDMDKALAAYQLAVNVNRLSPELWSRLGDINLRLGRFSDAADAFGRAIGAAGDEVGAEDARTWSNLGSSLWSLYLEAVDERRKGKEKANKAKLEENSAADTEATTEPADENDIRLSDSSVPKKKEPEVLLAQSLAAYKRGATIANDNWRIWDNVVTLASRMRPIPVADLVLAIRAVLRIRDAETALDVDVLRLLLHEAVLATPRDKSSAVPYEPPRGTPARLVNELFERDVVPRITAESALWELVARLRAWRGDFAGAIDAAEKGWRAAVGTAGAALSTSGGGATASNGSGNWLVNREGWDVVVARTDELVSALENWGPDVPEIGDRWRGKARSAVRSVLGKARESWEGSEGWVTLEHLLDGLKK